MHGIQLAKFHRSRTNSRKVYGLIRMPVQSSYLTDRQHLTLHTQHRLRATIKYRAKWGIWVGSPCTRQCGYALASTRCIPSDISRLLDDVHLLGDVHHVGCRITSPIGKV